LPALALPSETTQMKKIIVVLDESHSPQSALDFVLQLFLREPVWITGIFVPAAVYDTLLCQCLEPATAMDWNTLDGDMAAGNVRRFETFCQNNRIRYQGIEAMNEGLSWQELRQALAGADLLVLGDVPAGRIPDYGGRLPASGALGCPVVLLPGHCILPTHIIFINDGTQTANAALKQLTAVMPALTELEIMMLHTTVSPHDAQLEAYLASHYNRCSSYHPHIDPVKYVDAWLRHKGNALLAGALPASPGMEGQPYRSILDAVAGSCMPPVFLASPF